jgi:dTDP-4-dehydrorhamnose reductase
VILITGINGLVGQALAEELLAHGHEVVGIGRGASRLQQASSRFRYYAVDLNDPFAAEAVMAKEKPAVVVHGAAMTQVDDCERMPKEAHQINVEATARLLLDAEAQSAFFIFLSTDFVFDGQKGLYSEDESLHPLSWYGQTKMEAEAIVETAEVPWAIIRTCLVYGQAAPGGRQNFYSWIRSSLEAGKPIKVVDDQWRTPTWVRDLARGIRLVIEQKATGTWHLSGEEIYTPYQMAMAIADFHQLDTALIERVTADIFSQPGKRPARTGFDISKAKKDLGFAPGSFLQNLEKMALG